MRLGAEGSDSEVSSVANPSVLVAFVGLTFLLSWPIWYASGVLSQIQDYALNGKWLIAQVGVLAPSLSALLLSSLSGRRMAGNALRILAIQILPLALPGLIIVGSAPAGIKELDSTAAAIAILVSGVIVLFFSPLNRSLLLPGTGDRPGRPDVSALGFSLFLIPGLFLMAWLFAGSYGGRLEVSAAEAGVLQFSRILVVSFAFNLILGGSLGEEIGWRGFFLPALLSRYGPLYASLILGLVWAIWHLPVDLAGGFGFGGPAAIIFRIVWTLPLTVIFTWLYQRSGGSLLVPLFLHTSINFLGELGFSNFAAAVGGLTLINILVAALIVFSWISKSGTEAQEEP